MRFKRKRLCAWILATTMVFTSLYSSNSVLYASDDAGESVVAESCTSEEVTEEVTKEVTEEVTTEVVDFTEEKTETTTNEVSVESEVESTPTPEVSEGTEVTEEITTEIPTEDTKEIPAKESKEKGVEEVEDVGDLYIKLTDGGTIKVSYQDGETETVESKDGVVSTTKNGVTTQLTNKTQDNYFKLSKYLVNSTVKVEVNSKDNYKVEFYNKKIDGGEVNKKEFKDSETSYTDIIKSSKEIKLDVGFVETQEGEKATDTEATSEPISEDTKVSETISDLTVDLSKLAVGTKVSFGFTKRDGSKDTRVYSAKESENGSAVYVNDTEIEPIQNIHFDEPVFSNVSIETESLDTYIATSFSIESKYSGKIIESKDNYNNYDVNIQDKDYITVESVSDELLEAKEAYYGLGNKNISFYLDNRYWTKQASIETRSFNGKSGKVIYYTNDSYSGALNDYYDSRAKKQTWSKASFSYTGISAGSPATQLKNLFKGKVGKKVAIPSTGLNKTLREGSYSQLYSSSNDKPNIPKNFSKSDVVSYKVSSMTGKIGGDGNTATFTLGDTKTGSGVSLKGLTLSNIVCNTRHAASTIQFPGEEVESSKASDWIVDVHWTYNVSDVVEKDLGGGKKEYKGKATFSATFYGYNTKIYGEGSDPATLGGQSWRCKKSWSYNFDGTGTGSATACGVTKQVVDETGYTPYFADSRIADIYDASDCKFYMNYVVTPKTGTMTADVMSGDVEMPIEFSNTGTYGTSSSEWVILDSSQYTPSGNKVWYTAYETCPNRYLTASSPIYSVNGSVEASQNFMEITTLDDDTTKDDIVPNSYVTFKNVIRKCNFTDTFKKVNWKDGMTPVPSATYYLYYIPIPTDSTELATMKQAAANYGMSFREYLDTQTPIFVTSATSAADGTVTFNRTGYYGIYYIVEKYAPVGYQMDPTFCRGEAIWVDASGNEQREAFKYGSNYITAYGMDGHAEKEERGTVSVQKLNAESTDGKANSGTNFEGIEYTIYLDQDNLDYIYSNTDPSVKKTWLRDQPITRGDGSQFVLTCNADGFAEMPESLDWTLQLPIGKYYLKETKGNDYYKNDDPTKYTFSIIGGNRRVNIVAVGKNSTTGGSGNTPYRGDISLLKTRSDNGRPVGSIPFLVTNTKTGEEHVIVTDENGVYNSSLYVGTPISERNKNDDLINISKEGIIKTSEIGEPCGIWFGIGADNKPIGTEADINRGSLVTVENAENSSDAYCKYTVKELRCERNSNMEELYSGTITVVADTVVAVGNGNVSNTPINPSVSTDIVCEETKTRLMAKGKEVNAIDTVTCNNLELGHKYQIVSEIYDTETKEVMVDSDGKPLESQSEVFIADENTLTFKENGQGNSINVDVKFTFNSENMGGTSGVAQLNLYDITAAEEDSEADAYQEKYIVAEEHDFTLENQTIVIPRIETDAYDVTFQNAQGNPTYKEIDFGNAQGNGGQEGNAQGDDTQTDTNNGTTQTTDGTTNNENAQGGSQETTDETNAEDTPSVDSEVEVEVSHEELFSRDVTINIKDKVSLYNFLLGETYTVTGQVYKIELDENNKEYVTREKVAEVTLDDAKTVTIENPTEDFVTLDYTIEDKNVDTTRKHYYVVFEQVYATAGLREPVLVADHEDPNDERQQIKTLGLFSKFYGEESKRKVIKATKPGEKVTLTDTLYVQGMLIGEEYTLHNEMYDKDTGEVIVINDVPVSQTKVFTATKEDMEFNFDYELDTSSLGGKDVVFGEWIEYKGVTVLSHRDLRDPQEAGTVPTVKTKAHDVQTLTSIGSLDSTTIVDTVTVTNSQVGVPQTIKGILMDKATGKPLGEAEGFGPFEAKTVIENPEKRDYEATVEFKIPDSTILEGKNIVVFEGLYINNEKVAFHEDINDEGQTITFCKERTTANWNNGTKLVNAEDIEYTLYDVVHYTNLVPGKKYEQVGKLWQDDGTGKAVPFLRNGVQVESRVEFTPETAEGDITLEFKINTADLEGQQIVVFEDLYYNATKIATHSDINDKDQTVYIPKLRTTANWDNGTKLVIAKDKEYTINDVVHYSKLIVGKEYTVTGTLMQDNGDGVAVAYIGEDGNPLTSSVTFTAETSEGDITVPFKINTLDLEGQTFVVFEDLYHLGNKIGTHSDITDKDQTVYIPQIGTTATSKDGEKTLKVGEKVKLVDEVEYENLIEGETYTLKGYVVKKKGKGKYSKVTKKQEVEFVAKNSGITKMNFTIDTRKLQGKELVVFEYVYDIDGHLVAVHEDIDDEGQTVKVEELPDTPSIPRTLDNIFAILLLGAAFILLGVGIVSKSNKKKEQ